MTVTQDNLAWLDHLPKGWHPLYRDLLGDIARIDPTATVSQAKQKFGELRVYMKGYDERIYKLIRAAEVKSRATCEECGARGRLVVSPTGYYETVCETHAEGGAEVKSPIVARITIVPPPRREE
jgi:hypothetical protein